VDTAVVALRRLHRRRDLRAEHTLPGSVLPAAATRTRHRSGERSVPGPRSPAARSSATPRRAGAACRSDIGRRRSRRKPPVAWRHTPSSIDQPTQSSIAMGWTVRPLRARRPSSQSTTAPRPVGRPAIM
jgi:hypothetical protein